MDDTDDRIPTVETYRGVGIHAFQPADRIRHVVKPAIDAVYGMSDAGSLAAYVEDPTLPPEARLLAAARCEALWELAAENRAARPNVDKMLLRAHTAGLTSLRWIDPRHYGSLLQRRLGPGREPPRREPTLSEDVQEARSRDARR
jgi:hypothetical protein